MSALRPPQQEPSDHTNAVTFESPRAEAQSENEHLRAENARLREALEKIASRGQVSDAKGTWSKEVHNIARTALSHTEEGES